MSGRQPAAPQRREIEIMRVLFERQLKDRAIALADSRWPGSGKMVGLAYDWSQLGPEERRAQLSNIGPEEIARLREFAALNPNLAAAIDELDRRGALPHFEAAAVDIAAASREAGARDQPPDTPPAAHQHVDPGMHQHAEPERASKADAAERVRAGSAAGPDDSSEEPVYDFEQREVYDFESREAYDFENEEVYDFQDKGIDALEVDMPELDLGLPTTKEFLQNEARRREEAAQATEESMARVRERLDQAAQRAFERGSAFASPRLPDIPRPTLPSAAQTPAAGQTAIRAIAAPRELARELEQRIVASLHPGDPRPSDDELVALANDLQIGLSEHRITFDNRKSEFGALVNEYGRVTVRPGRLARAVAEPNLVVVSGRLTASLAQRLEEGFLDIPGTRATVKLHPKTRVLLLGGQRP